MTTSTKIKNTSDNLIKYIISLQEAGKLPKNVDIQGKEIFLQFANDLALISNP